MTRTKSSRVFRLVALATACVVMIGTAAAQQPAFQDELLDHYLGAWVLEGTIAHKQTTHDVTADWVLNHQYMRLHEISREKNAKGEPAYEAMVFIAWDSATSRYVAIWLDMYGSMSRTSMGYAPRNGDEIRFLFGEGKDIFHTTFLYNRAADTWDWRMDNDDNGTLKPFARVKLTHAQTQATTPHAENTMTHHAAGAFDVKITPQDDQSVEGVSRMLGDKQYHGDLEGTAKFQMLAAGSAKNSGVYLAIEAFTGTLQGKSGGFSLHHTGIMSGGSPDLNINVVPGSGTGQLAGIGGKMNINIAPDGKHSYDFEYTLPGGN